MWRNPAVYVAKMLLMPKFTLRSCVGALEVVI